MLNNAPIHDQSHADEYCNDYFVVFLSETSFGNIGRHAPNASVKLIVGKLDWTYQPQSSPAPCGLPLVGPGHACDRLRQGLGQGGLGSLGHYGGRGPGWRALKVIGFLECRFSFGGRGDACFAAGRLARGRAGGRNEERNGTDGSCRSFLQPSCSAEIHQTPPLRRRKRCGGEGKPRKQQQQQQPQVSDRGDNLEENKYGPSLVKMVVCF